MKICTQCKRKKIGFTKFVWILFYAVYSILLLYYLPLKAMESSPLALLSDTEKAPRTVINGDSKHIEGTFFILRVHEAYIRIYGTYIIRVS